MREALESWMKTLLRRQQPSSTGAKKSETQRIFLLVQTFLKYPKQKQRLSITEPFELFVQMEGKTSSYFDDASLQDVAWVVFLFILKDQNFFPLSFGANLEKLEISAHIKWNISSLLRLFAVCACTAFISFSFFFSSIIIVIVMYVVICDETSSADITLFFHNFEALISWTRLKIPLPTTTSSQQSRTEQ